jgi:hypothetical protein
MIAEAFNFVIVVTEYCYAAGWVRFHSGLMDSFGTVASLVIATIARPMHAIVACLRTLTDNDDSSNDRSAIDKALP